MLLAVAVPSAVELPSDTVTVDPAGAVPVSVTVSLVLADPVLMTGAVGVDDDDDEVPAVLLLTLTPVLPYTPGTPMLFVTVLLLDWFMKISASLAA